MLWNLFNIGDISRWTPENVLIFKNMTLLCNKHICAVDRESCTPPLKYMDHWGGGCSLCRTIDFFACKAERSSGNSGPLKADKAGQRRVTRQLTWKYRLHPCPLGESIVLTKYRRTCNLSDIQHVVSAIDQFGIRSYYIYAGSTARIAILLLVAFVPQNRKVQRVFSCHISYFQHSVPAWNNEEIAQEM